MDDRTKTEAWPGQQATPVAPPHEAPPPRDVPPRRGGWLGRAIIWLLLIPACAGTAYWYFQRADPTRARGGRSTVPPVATVAVASGDVNVTINALGTVTSLATITVRSQISGQLVAVNYTEGQIV